VPRKLVLVARSDLGMGRGKQAAQVAHAAVAAVLATARSRDFRAWLQEGQPKVVLRAGSEEELLGIAAKAIEAGLHTELVRDAGRTQLDPGTLTCCAIGPADSDKIDAVTGTLSLL
jgi:peptidyl-tRNA hydrolase, PTH2 family